MKLLLFIFLCSTQALASALIHCGPGTIRTWFPGTGHSCVPLMTPQHQLAQGCFGPWEGFPHNPFSHFPAPLYQPNFLPWWAYQGNLFYPNLHYPGAWSYPGIQERYYPGRGEVFAAKPNVYINSVHQDKKFSFRFLESSKPSFLATTPLLEKDLSWKGKIVEGDKFEVDGVNYDYLFYDVRLDKEKLQFDHGMCSSREGVISWMLTDLKEMRYPSISLQDFEEHWRVKIPDYPYYCVYPQYNRQLDPILPVLIDIEQNTFLRSLYVLVPHKTEPDVAAPQEIPFPSKDPAEFRPASRIQRENEFREWGVAFFGY